MGQLMGRFRALRHGGRETCDMPGPMPRPTVCADTSRGDLLLENARSRAFVSERKKKYFITIK